MVLVHLCGLQPALQCANHTLHWVICNLIDLIELIANHPFTLGAWVICTHMVWYCVWCVQVTRTCPVPPCMPACHVEQLQLEPAALAAACTTGNVSDKCMPIHE